MKLLPKFLFLLMPFIIGPLLWLGYIAYQQISETADLKSSSNLQTTVNHIKSQSQSRIANAISSINLLASESTFMKYATTEDEEQRYLLFQRALLSRFHAYQNAYPEYHELRFILPDGYEDTRWASITSPNFSDDESKTAYFKTIQDAESDFTVLSALNPDTNRNVIYVAKRIRLQNKSLEGVTAKSKVRGYLLITLNLKFLQQLISETAEPIAIFDSHPNTLFQNSPAHKQQDKIKSIFTRYLESPGGNSTKALVAPLLDGQLYIVALKSTDFTDALTEKLSTNLFITIFATIALSVGALFFVFQRIVLSPLESIKSASDQIKEGNFEVSLRTDGKDELSDLAKTFNNMSTSIKDYNEKIRFIAYHDSLTQLPNRRMFQYYLNNAIAMAKRKDELLALLFIDIDNFKTINDSLGHNVGDDLLRLFAKRVGACVRESDFIAHTEQSNDSSDYDMIARLGGDEFTIVIPSIENAEEASTVASRIIHSLSKPFTIEQHELFVQASIGITIFPSDGETVEELIQSADIAMYSAKEKGKNNFQYYLASMNDKINNRMVLEHKLHRALDNNEFELYYQPQLNLRKSCLYGVEALIRWKDPEEGMIPPDKFIPLAEESGLIVDIGRWVMNEACRQAKDWHIQGYSDLHMSVNVSTVQFYRDDMEKLIVDTLKIHDFPASHFDIELTESIFMDSQEENLEVLKQIKALGISLSLDDFGTGYSSLSYLRTFPTDILKIDRSFIKALNDSEDGASLVTAIIALAKVMGIKVVAEGVETQRSLELLQRIGCDYIQGYLIAKPMPANELEALLVQQSSFINSALFDNQPKWH